MGAVSNEAESKIPTVVWGTGNVGRASIRAVTANPALELVGVIVANPPEKVGRDAGDLADLGVHLASRLPTTPMPCSQRLPARWSTRRPATFGPTTRLPTSRGHWPPELWWSRRRYMRCTTRNLRLPNFVIPSKLLPRRAAALCSSPVSTQAGGATTSCRFSSAGSRGGQSTRSGVRKSSTTRPTNSRILSAT